MRGLSAAQLLSVWEQGLSQAPIQRALALLAAACPERSAEALEKLSIGERDASLLTLREWTFGSKLTSLASCSHCHARVELDFVIDDIRATGSNQTALVKGKEEVTELHQLTVGNYEICFRLLNSQDLAAITGCEDVGAARRLLLERCLSEVQHKGEPKSAGELPTEVIDVVVKQMEETDPQAIVQLALCCPACNGKWQVHFDIVSFFWSEIDTWASRLLHEVHTLAMAYGWRETDILAMSPWRRHCYLQMVAR